VTVPLHKRVALLTIEFELTSNGATGTIYWRKRGGEGFEGTSSPQFSSKILIATVPSLGSTKIAERFWAPPRKPCSPRIGSHKFVDRDRIPFFPDTL
jgi:hypothetical protein